MDLNLDPNTTGTEKPIEPDFEGGLHGRSWCACSN